MALVAFEDNQLQTQQRSSTDWITGEETKGSRFTKSENVSSEPTRYPINYQKVDELLNIEGLKTGKDDASTPEAHAMFMKKVREIFIKPGRAQLPPVALQQRSQFTIPSSKPTGPTAARSNSSYNEDVDKESREEESHDIRDYTKHLRKHRRRDEVDMALKTDGVKILRKLLRKLPFQRTAEDINIMYKALKSFTNFSSMVPNRILRELCFVAQLDNWKEDDFPVFGSSGMHMILKGSVVTVHSPHMYQPNTSMQEFKRECTNNKHSPNGQKPPQISLGVGECFGTFEAIDGQTMHKTMLMVNTQEQNCEFLKVTTSDYQRVIEQLKNKEQTKKLNLLQACSHFRMWTRQPKLKVANLIEWQQFAPNTVIVSEGYKAPFIGLILSGECHVLKQLEVLSNLPNGEQERKTRQVVMGNIGPNESFAELSLLKEEPMSYSIITSTELTLGTISPDSLYSLDETTLELLLQSCQPTFDTLTKEKIELEYMDQESKREWNQYRHNAVIEAINAHGVRPGYGKWKKS